MPFEFIYLLAELHGNLSFGIAGSGRSFRYSGSYVATGEAGEEGRHKWRGAGADEELLGGKEAEGNI